MKNKNYKSYLFILLSLVSAILFIKATFEEIINDKNKQAEILQKHIDDSKSEIKYKSSEIQSLKYEKDSIESKYNALNDFLKNYQNQNFLSPDEIAIETNMVIFLEDEVEKIQQSFKNKIVNLYKHGKNYELELLLSSKTPNEFLRRNQYLQKFALSRKKELRDLKAKKYVLDEKKKLLSLSVSSQRYYIESKRNERAEYEELLKTINEKLSSAENEIIIKNAKIDKNEEEITRIKNYIQLLNDNRQNYKGSKSTRLSYSSDSFEKLKGGLNLPVDFSLIKNEYGKYGDYTNNASGIKWFNNGIDFSIAKGSKVYAVAAGTVSLIGEAPYYGKVIIITHDGSYRSVYSCLGDVNVSAGDKIKLNQIIGRTGETLDGQMLHFEIWQNTNPLNPHEWIRF